MKKAFLVLGLLIFVAGAAFAQKKTPLDDAINLGIDKVRRNTADAGQKVVILIFSPEYPHLADYVVDKIAANLTTKGNFSLVSQDEHDIKLTKYRRDTDAFTDAQEIAQNLDVQLVIQVFLSDWVSEGLFPKKGTSFRVDYTELTAPETFNNGSFQLWDVAVPKNTLAASNNSDTKGLNTERSEDDPPAFMLHVTYSGANNKVDEVRDAKIPMDYFTTSQHSLSLAMGLNVFKILNLGIDFGIKDFNFGGKDIKFTDIVNLGGMIGINWASIVLDYRFINGDVEFPSKKDGKAESVAGIAPGWQPYNQFSRVESRTVALMAAPFKWLGLGLIWNNATGASMVQNKYFDPKVETNTFGVRAHVSFDHFSKPLEMGWAVGESEDIYWCLIADLYIDLAFGKATLSSDVEKAIKQGSILKMKDVDLGVMYNGVRGMLGAHLVKQPAENRYWEIIGVGLDINGGGTTAADVSFGSTVIGVFVRMGFAF